MENLSSRIEINAAIMVGKPIIKGTRITVELIIDELASGYSTQDVLQAHPNLTEEDILAALQYASSVIRNEKIYTTTS
jgi:uncharacterized protein (DUF433 family)